MKPPAPKRKKKKRYAYAWSPIAKDGMPWPAWIKMFKGQVFVELEKNYAGWREEGIKIKRVRLEEL